jgi:anaerobic magnesium-protoporphyrin IX monomethyl ester cyclase
LRLLRRFLRHMPLRDVVYLIVKPFLGKRTGPTKNEVLSRAVEHRALQDTAAEITGVPDDLLERVIEGEGR